MLWEGKRLSDIREADVRGVIASGLREHLQLEYKRDIYDDNERGRREFLLDVCMFANAAGGVLLIGIPERRDENQRATGEPDPNGVLGVEVPNPDALLLAYDARVTESIEERLPLESFPIDVGNGRRVLAIRIPNSTNKPHSVRHEKHIYFPSRRERHRYHMSVSEIKETVMRTASRLEQAERALENSFEKVKRNADWPYFVIGIVPVFAEDFSVDVRSEVVRQAVANFHHAGRPESRGTIFTFDGIERHSALWEHKVKLCRNGLLCSSLQLVSTRHPTHPGDQHRLDPTSLDLLLRTFLLRTTSVYEAARVSAPYVMGVMLRTKQPLVGRYPGFEGFGEEETEPVAIGDYPFPYMQIDDLSNVDRTIRPICDQAHQMFGRAGSPCFNADGVWIGRTQGA